MKKTLKVFVALATLCFAAAAAAAPADKKADAPAWRDLLDAKLSNFDVWLSYRGDQIMGVIKGTTPDIKPVGLNPPGQSVFTVVTQDGQPVLRVSGEYY